MSSIVNIIFSLYGYLILARVIMSWVAPDTKSPLVDVLIVVTEPVLAPCREIMFSIIRLFSSDPRAMQMDFSPIIAFLLLDHVVRPAALALITMIF